MSLVNVSFLLGLGLFYGDILDKVWYIMYIIGSIFDVFRGLMLSISGIVSGRFYGDINFVLR